MKQLVLNLKKYLNEETTIHRQKRIKTIRFYLIFQLFFLVPFFSLIYFLNHDIFKPVKFHAAFIHITYNSIMGLFFSMLGFFSVIWMFGLNLAVAAFCTTKWREYCSLNKRPYCNRFFFHIFKKDPVKQMWLEWGLWLFSLIICLIMMKSPESLQVNVNKKIMEHYGYTYCRNYYPEFGGTMELVFAREKKNCEEKP